MKMQLYIQTLLWTGEYPVRAMVFKGNMFLVKCEADI